MFLLFSISPFLKGAVKSTFLLIFLFLAPSLQNSFAAQGYLLAEYLKSRAANEVFPGADSIAELTGAPPVAKAYSGNTQEASSFLIPTLSIRQVTQVNPYSS